MKVIYIKNKPELIDNMSDMYDLVSNYMGDDAREYLEEYTTELEYTADHAMEIAKADCPDADSYEADLESNARAFQDIQDELNSLKDCERFSRKKIETFIRNVQSILNNQI